MRHADIASGIVLVVIGLVTLFGVIPWQIEEGPPDMMSPRLVPAMMMVLVIGLSALLAFRSWRDRPAPDAPAERAPITRAELVTLLSMGGVFALAIALYHWVSPLAAGIALMVGALLIFGERRPWVIILMPAAFMLAIWLLFYKVLGTAII